MPTFYPKIFFISTVGIVLVLATVVGGGKSAVAGNVAVSKVAKSSISEKLLLAQVVQSSPCITCLDQNRLTASPVPVPVKIPEPSMLAGLGLVACSLMVTRRRVKN
ncbi:PEP-CTERM sorting domain-containing protein [Tychonema sp. BBK16]|uniref:PEP-CTERM sorting domain-containing protein n=1 Tax=Tychonema sp. BBK16 TaxID=2699888 RepID=UPI0021044370|nr:PEP-CTERM sorting domain-containing protein [Tychonema sp. BBK16]